MNKPPAFQFYPKDFLTDDKVALMNLEQVGAYIKLLCYCWLNGGLPNDQEELRNMCGCSDAITWSKIWKKISKCFYEKNQKLFNKRLDKEKRVQKKRRKLLQTAGKKGAEKRWPGHSQAIARPMAKNSSSSSSSSSSSINNNPPISPQKISYNFEKKEWENISDKDKELWKKTYPACDIEHELLAMGDWLLSNPDRKKSNYRAFISRWLKKQQDRGGTKKGGDYLSKQEQKERRIMARFEGYKNGKNTV